MELLNSNDQSRNDRTVSTLTGNLITLNRPKTVKEIKISQN